MSYSAQDFVEDIDLGGFLNIVSTKGIYNQLSTASEIWKYILKLKKGVMGGREVRYLARKAYGSAAIQSLPVSTGAYPKGRPANPLEAIAHYKDFALTIAIPRTVVNLTGEALLQSADPITEEMDAKAIGAARIMSAQALGDGSGAIGLMAAAPTVSTADDTIVIQLSTASADAGRSCIGWFELEDEVKFAGSDGTAHGTINNAGTSVEYWRVTNVDFDNDQVTLQPYSSNDTLINISSATLGATDPTSGDYIYRKGTTPNDLTAISTNDWETLSEVMVGLESLLADDGRKVHNLTKSGAMSGTRVDWNNALLAPQAFQRGLSTVKRRVGQDRYKFRKAMMNFIALDQLVEAHQTNRMFQTRQDATFGVQVLGYQHGKDFVEFAPDEFVQKQRILVLPESNEVLEFHGADYELVEVNPGQKFHLQSNSSGTHNRQMQAYMEGHGFVAAKHAAGCLVIENFTTTGG